MPELKTPEKLLLVAAGFITAVGGVLAVVQPGDLGGDEVSSTEEAVPGVADETTTSGDVSTTRESRGAESPVVEGQVTTTTTTAPTTVPSESTTTIGGSGLGVTTPPSGGTDGLADTGHEATLGAGLAMLVVGLAGRRLIASRPAG